MLLRWGLARIVRVTQGVETRGLFGYETYLEWRKAERGMFFFLLFVCVFIMLNVGLNFFFCFLRSPCDTTWVSIDRKKNCH